MNLNLITHNNSLGFEISKLLRSSKYSKFKLAVAYAKTSGIGRIYNDLVYFSNNGGELEAIVGIDQSNTSYQALVNLKTFTGNKLYIHNDRNPEITFHPKIYIFGNKDIEKVIIGSSNLTAGGLYLNFEVNVGINLNITENTDYFRRQVNDYWNKIKSDQNTRPADDTLLKQLLGLGKVIDETKQNNFRKIIEREISSPFKMLKRRLSLPSKTKDLIIGVPGLSEQFGMTLSRFDVSPRSQDPVVLIPKDALKSYPLFWNWPDLFTLSHTGYPQLYSIATVKIDNIIYKDQHIRIYYYERKKEFRLQCELIKRNGKAGDIIIIEKNFKNPMEFKIELFRIGSQNHNKIMPLLIHLAPGKQKHYNYL